MPMYCYGGICSTLYYLLVVVHKVVSTGGTRSVLELIRTGLRTGRDRIEPVPSGLVCSPQDFKIIRTGLVPGSSPEGSRTRTRTDL
jgi:hypothetical protein